jgi:hypothetical protein
MERAAEATGSQVLLAVNGGLLRVCRGEPPELSIGWVDLNDGTRVLGVLGDPAVVEGQREITKCGGWRAYTEAEGIPG